MNKNKIRQYMIKAELVSAVICMISVIIMIIAESHCYQELLTNKVIEITCFTMLISAFLCIALVIVEHIYGQLVD